MNTDSLNKHLAEKVMEWELQSSLTWPGEQNIYKDPKNDSFWLKASDWNPSENIEQAMMCIQTMDEWHIHNAAGLIDAWTYRSKMKVGRGFTNKKDELPMAISLACAKATGYKE